MNWVAIRMLTGDRVKFFGLIFGVTFATFLMSQQVSVFVGIVGRSASQIVDVRDASIWVMDRRVRHFDEAPGLPDGALKRVRGVAGVQWAVRFFKGQVLARIEKGLPRSVILEAVDDANLVGAPQELIAGNLADLRRPYAVIVDKAGYEYLWPGEPVRLWREFEINDRRAVLVGVCKASPPFVTLPIMFTRFNEALMYVPTKRNLMNYVLAEAMPGENGANARQAHLTRDRTAGPHSGWILLEHDQLHARLDGHSGELRHHDRAGVHRRSGRGRTDVLPVYT